MRIAFFEMTQDEEINFFKQNLKEYELYFFSQALNAESLPEDTNFDALSVFVNSKIDLKVINAFPNLKAIFIRATGFDNIDVSDKLKGIMVFNVPSYGSRTVAEFTFALILTLTRKIYEAISRVKIEKKFSFENLCGTDLFNKTLGVIGTGKIGTNVIKIARCFEMNILAFDAFPNQDLANNLQFRYVPLLDLLKVSDIISLHVPLNSETRHLLNSKNIPLIKQGSLLINTSRGGVIETSALFQGLLSKKLGGVALDVLEEEAELKEEIELLSKNAIPEEKYKTLLEEQVLTSLPQFIITPHTAFYTKEAVQSIIETTALNIRNFLSGNYTNAVNK